MDLNIQIFDYGEGKQSILNDCITALKQFRGFIGLLLLVDSGVMLCYNFRLK